MLFPDGKLIIFSKAPIPGRVKKRLIPILGAEGAAELHQEMLEQKLCMAHDKRIAVTDLYCYPDRNYPYFQQLTSRFALELHNQSGADLGERMVDALQRSVSKHSYAVLIGTDSPPLDSAYLTQAFQALEDGADAVIGPAMDGGYILIGLRRFDRTIFEDIDWGGEEVFSQTSQRLTQLGFDWVELETLWDVDRPEDLERLERFFN